MALLVSTQSNLKNALVPLADKLDENNFWSWKKSVLLTLRTLKLQDHLSFDKIPAQFEESEETEADSTSITKDDTNTVKKTLSSETKTLQESQAYFDWVQNDCALMTWLDASMTLSYKNKVVSCSSFAEAWETIHHIFTVSSNTRIHSIKNQLRDIKKTGDKSTILDAYVSNEEI